MSKSNWRETIEVPEDMQEFLPIILSLADKYYENQTPRISYEDYVNVGLAAAYKARESFDPTRGAKLKSYVYSAIRNGMNDEFSQTRNVVSGCTPHRLKTNPEVRAEIDFINNTALSLSVSRHDIVPMYPPTHEYQPKRPRPTLKEIIVESGIDGPLARIERIELQEQIDLLIDELDEQSQQIVYRRIFDGDTFQSIADDNGWSHRTVTYRFNKALEQLKSKCEEVGLDIYA